MGPGPENHGWEVHGHCASRHGRLIRATAPKVAAAVDVRFLERASPSWSSLPVSAPWRRGGLADPVPEEPATWAASIWSFWLAQPLLPLRDQPPVRPRGQGTALSSLLLGLRQEVPARRRYPAGPGGPVVWPSPAAPDRYGDIDTYAMVAATWRMSSAAGGVGGGDPGEVGGGETFCWPSIHTDPWWPIPTAATRRPAGSRLLALHTGAAWPWHPPLAGQDSLYGRMIPDRLGLGRVSGPPTMMFTATAPSRNWPVQTLEPKAGRPGLLPGETGRLGGSALYNHLARWGATCGDRFRAIA